MKHYLSILSTVYLCLLLAGASAAQSQAGLTATSSSPASIPHVVKFSGNAKDEAGHPRSGVAGITFALYKDQQGGAPLWLETQNVQADSKGNYTVLLGSTKPEGLPADLFTSNEARWLAVQQEGQAEQSRVVFVSVPYALKAADAETIGGLPPSAFVRANPENAAPGGISGETVADSHSTNDQPQVLQTVKTPGGKTNFLPIWTGTNTIGNSTLFQSGGKVGIGNTRPAATLDVNGSLNVPQTKSSTVGVIDLGGASFIHACCSSTNDNTFVGTNAGNFTTTGSSDTAVGFSALHSLLNGNQNTAVGDFAGGQITTGIQNTAIGFSADGSDHTGTDNTIVGFQAGTIGSLNNATAIGAFAVAEQSNSMILGCTLACPNGGTSPNVGIGTNTPDNLLTVNGSADKPGGGSWGVFSDGRLKTVAGTFETGLDAILKMTPVRYRYKEQNAMGIKDNQEHVGFVAQQVEKVIPEAVSRNSRGYLLVNNDPILWTMLNAIKEQQKQIEALTHSAQEKDAEIQKLAEQGEIVQKLQTKLAELSDRLAGAGVDRNLLADAVGASGSRP